MFTSIQKVGRMLKLIAITRRPEMLLPPEQQEPDLAYEYDDLHRNFIIDLYGAVQAEWAVHAAARRFCGDLADDDAVRVFAEDYVLDVLNDYLREHFAGDHEKMLKRFAIGGLGIEYDQEHAE